MNIINLKNITISFNKKKILNDINMEIESGRLLSISGKSGSGKTTFLSMLSGMIKPDSGKIYYKGRNIYRWSDFSRSRFRNRKIGIIFQSFNLLQDYTIYQNIIFPAVINFSSKNIRKHAEYLMEYLEISEIKDQLPSTVSGGEKQRAAIARAMINYPEVILADEPTGNLDIVTGKSIFLLFKKIQKEYGITFITATHDKYIINKSDHHYAIENGMFIKK